MKACNKCGVVKPLSEYYDAKGMRDGKRGDCIACFRAASNARTGANPEPNRQRASAWQKANPERVNAWHRERRKDPAVKRSERAGNLKRKFGMTLADYDEMLQRQGEVCALCRRAAPEGTRFHIDHDHRTGRVRAILCVKCNNGLGLFEEDPELLELAARYLTEHAIRGRIDELKSRRLA